MISCEQELQHEKSKEEIVAEKRSLLARKLKKFQEEQKKKSLISHTVEELFTSDEPAKKSQGVLPAETKSSQNGLAMIQQHSDDETVTESINPETVEKIQRLGSTSTCFGNTDSSLGFGNSGFGSDERSTPRKNRSPIKQKNGENSQRFGSSSGYGTTDASQVFGNSGFGPDKPSTSRRPASSSRKNFGNKSFGTESTQQFGSTSTGFGTNGFSQGFGNSGFGPDKPSNSRKSTSSSRKDFGNKSFGNSGAETEKFGNSGFGADRPSTSRTPTSSRTRRPKSASAERSSRKSDKYQDFSREELLDALELKSEFKIVFCRKTAIFYHY